MADDSGKSEPQTEFTAEEAKGQFGDLLSRAGYAKERILITRHGKPIAGLVPFEDLARLDAA